MYNNLIKAIMLNSNEEQSMYDTYLENLESAEYKDFALYNLEMMRRDDPSEEEIKLGILNIFLYENDDSTYEIATCDLLEFPLEKKAYIIEKFIDFANFHLESQRQICKLIYTMWPKYMKSDSKLKDESEVHMSIYKSFNTIKTKLMDFKEIDTADDYRTFCRTNKSGYLHCHLLALLPLLEEGIDILMKVITFPYEDAQDGIMFGISQYDPKKFLPKYREILKFFHSYYDQNYKNDIGVSNQLHIETGTGMVADINRINKEYYRKGVNVYEDEGILDVFNQKYNEKYMYKEYFQETFLKDDLPEDLGIAMFNFS